MQRVIERGPWEIDLGVGFNYRLWGLGVIMEFWGKDSPNGISLNLGPFSVWAVVWYWKYKS